MNSADSFTNIFILSIINQSMRIRYERDTEHEWHDHNYNYSITLHRRTHASQWMSLSALFILLFMREWCLSIWSVSLKLCDLPDVANANEIHKIQLKPFLYKWNIFSSPFFVIVLQCVRIYVCWSINLLEFMVVHHMRGRMPYTAALTLYPTTLSDKIWH